MDWFSKGKKEEERVNYGRCTIDFVIKDKVVLNKFAKLKIPPRWSIEGRIRYGAVEKASDFARYLVDETSMRGIYKFISPVTGEIVCVPAHLVKLIVISPMEDYFKETK